MADAQAPPLFSLPRIWLWPMLATVAALSVCWSLLPHAREIWQREPARPTLPLALTLQRVAAGQRELRLPLGAPFVGVGLAARLGSGAAVPAMLQRDALVVTLPADLPAGAQLLRVTTRWGAPPKDDIREDLAIPLAVLPARLPAPRLLLQQRGALHLQVQGAPGSTARVWLLPDAAGEPDEPGERPGKAAEVPPSPLLPRTETAAVSGAAGAASPRVLVAELALPQSGVAGVDLPLVPEVALRLRARLVAPPEAPAAPSPSSGPPVSVGAAGLLPEGPVGALAARLAVGAREVRFSWDVTLPDSYLPAGRDLRPDRDHDRVELFLAGEPQGPRERVDCGPLRDLAVERIGAATRLSGQCALRPSESLRTRLFHSGTRLLIRGPTLAPAPSDQGLPPLPPLPLALEVSPDVGTVLAEALPPLRARWEPPLRTEEPGGYVRLDRRALFPLADIPEPTALLLFPVRRVAVHGVRLINQTLRLLPLMILLPLIAGLRRRRSALSRGLPLLLLLGMAAAPLTFTDWLGTRTGLPRDPYQISAAVLWELAALTWVFSSVRARGLVRTALPTLGLLALVLLPLFAIHLLWRVTGTPQVESGGWLSIALSSALLALVLLGVVQLGEAASLLRWQRACLVVLTLGLFLSGGLSAHDFYVDAAALRLGGLAPLLTVLSLLAALQPEPAPSDTPLDPQALHALDERLLWPLFLAAVPTLVMDHGIPFGLLSALAVYRIWNPKLLPPFRAPGSVETPSSESPDPVPDEAEAVLVALEEHPLLLLARDREALQAAARRGTVAPEAYGLAQQVLVEREAELASAGYSRAYGQLPNVLSLGTADGPLPDGWRSLKTALAPMAIYLLFLLLVNEPFDPQRLLWQLAGSLRLMVQLLALAFFFGFAFSALPGRNGLIKALYTTLLTLGCGLPAGLSMWYRTDQIVQALAGWVGVLGILGWVGLWGFDLHRLRMVRRGIFDLRRVPGYSRGFALTTSIILGIFTTVVSGLTGKVGAYLQSAVSPAPPAVSAPASNPQ